MTSAIAPIAALLIGYAMVSRRLERLNVSGTMFFTTAGLLAGPVLGLRAGATITQTAKHASPARGRGGRQLLLLCV